MAEMQYCEWMTGMPKRFYNLIVAVETHTGAWVQFKTNGFVNVDWGNGKILAYEPGIVYGRQMAKVDDNGLIIEGNPIIIRALEDAPGTADNAKVTQLSFGNGAGYDREYKKINIVKAVDLVDVTKLCYRLEELREFKFFGNNKIKSFESAWEDCTELIKFEGMDTTEAVTFKRAWKNCNKLVWFPNLYAKECLTVEEAWRGCTSMRVFPLIDVSNCINFRSAWRGNERLRYFPYLDTVKGINFDHAWSYCTRLSYFPELNFHKAENMDYAFSFMKSIRNMPHLKTEVGETFRSTFKQMCSLKCIASVNTLNKSLTEPNPTLDMFKNTPTLYAPTPVQQELILEGDNYVNEMPCYYNAGRSVFFVHIQTDKSFCSDIAFTLTGGDFEIDWGDGTYFPYNEGFVSNIPIENNGINIRSEEDITKIEFHTDVMTHIEFKRARTITDMRAMCMNLKKLQYFEIMGVTGAIDYSDMLRGCSGLTEIGEIDLSQITTSARMCRDDMLLEKIGMRYYDAELDGFYIDPIDLSTAEDLHEMFYGCDSIKMLQDCITPIGKNFERMFAGMTSLKCLGAVDTRMATHTNEMFYQDNVLLRPTHGEQAKIKAGYNYNNGDNCGGPLAIIFRGIDLPVILYIDADVKVDWGDGNIVTYLAGSKIEGTPMSNSDAYIIGDGTTIDWQTDTMSSIIFINADNITNMSSMFEGKSKLKTFEFYGESYVENFSYTFKDSGIEDFVAPPALVGAKDFTGMFQNTAYLNRVSAMNTEDGIDFEYMFADSGLQCLAEINTLKGDFPPHLIPCDDVLDCESVIACFGSSTMFQNTTPIHPTYDEIRTITSRNHWIGVTNCLKPDEGGMS